MVMQNWETTEGFNVIPDEWLTALTAVLETFREMGRSNVLDWKYVQEATDLLDKAQRGCAAANAMPAQQDLSELWQKLDDLFMDHVQNKTSPADAITRIIDVSEDLSAVLTDNGGDLDEPTNVV